MSGAAPRFVSTLKVERTSDGAAWQLTHPLVYQSVVANDVFIVPVGFETDFASVPRLPLVFWLTGDAAQEAAVVHDYLYSTRVVSRKMADEVFAEASRVIGVPAWRRGLMWFGVRIGGGAYWKASEPPEPVI